MAQEVDNPLASVIGALERLQDRVRRGEPVGEESLSLVGDALDAARRATALVRDLRVLTAAPSTATLELPEVIHAATRIATTMTGVAARLVVGPVAAVVVADALVGQAALWLAVTGLREARSLARLDVSVSGGGMVLSLRHDGADPPDDAASRDRAVCASLVTLLGGELRADAEGSVRVTLPVRAVAAEPPSPAPWPAPRGRVLVIDDDPGVAEVLAARLEQAWSVDICTDPVRALALLRAPGPWDAVVCDVRMEPLSGPELYVRLCAEAPAWRHRFVFVSAGVPTADEVRVIRDGGSPLLTKPNTLHRLVDAVSDRVTRSRAPAPA